jgi:hypothetical protein
MPLDSRTVDRIFTRLLAAYGSRWLTHIQGVPEQLLRTDWATVLDGVPAWQIDHALEVLDEGPNPPTSRMFRQWCMRSPDAAKPKQARLAEPQPTLAATKAGLTRLAAELGRLKDLQAKRKPGDWIDDLRARSKAGHLLTLAQQDMLREADQAKAPAGDWVSMKMEPVPHEHFPPAMRAEIPPPRVKKGLL